jgi:hypothetical protein
MTVRALHRATTMIDKNLISLYIYTHTYIHTHTHIHTRAREREREREREPFQKFVDWGWCATVMQREAVTVMPSCSGGVT